MKKINILTFMLMGVALLTACEDDRDSNPIIQEPTTFVLNTPANATNVYDLNQSKNIELTCTQPDYGYPAVVTYTVQVDLTDKWVDETETTDASYLTLPATSTSAKVDTDAKELNKAIVKLSGWTSENDYDGKPMSVFVRLYAHIGSNGYPIHSNSIKLNVTPYYLDVTDAVPVTYYLLGDFIGDIPWGNPTMEAGTAYFPMSLVKGYPYDVNTGKGEFTYTGYVPASQGFKVVAVPGQWDDQWGNSGSKGSDNLINDKNSENIMVSTAGWYKLHLNTIKNELTMKATTFETQPVEYDAITLSYGSETVELTKVTMEHSHVWYTDVTIAESCKAKFTSGDKSWGGEVFPFGSCADDATISCKPGDYVVFFNDLDECYYFKAK